MSMGIFGGFGGRFEGAAGMALGPDGLLARFPEVRLAW